MMIKTKKASTTLPGNKLLWKDIILSEAVNRQSDLDGRIENFRIINTNNDGNGMALITLVGSKAFLPVVIKEFELQPIDVIFYREGNKTNTCYLCKRNVLELTIKSSIGRPIKNPGTYSDAAVNLLSPSGGYPYSSNPFYSSGMNQMQPMKSASLSKKEEIAFGYAKNKLKEANLWTDNISEYFPEVEDIKPRDMYVTVSRLQNDVYHMYQPTTKTASVLNLSQLQELFSGLDVEERQIKTANLLANNHTTLGDFISRTGNVFLKEEKSADYLSLSGPHLPARDDVYMYGGMPAYINAKMRCIDGTMKNSYALLVRLGEFTIGKDFSGFKKRNEASSINEQREDLLPYATSIKSGDYICLFNERDRSVSVPIKVVSTANIQGVMSIKGKTLIGLYEDVDISFYDGDKIIHAGNNMYLYPIIGSKVCSLPKTFVKAEQILPKYDLKKMHNVVLKKGSSKGFEFIENNELFKIAKPDEAFFILINRYGMSEEQSIKMMQKVNQQGRVNLSIKYIADEPPIDMLNDKRSEVNNESISMMEKEAVNKIIKTASDLMKIKSKINSFNDENLLAKIASMDIVMDKKISETLTEIDNLGLNKQADERGFEAANQRAEQSQANIGMSGASLTINQPGGLLSSLMNVPKLERNVAQIIDQLSFYSLGKIRPEEKMNLMKKLRESLKESENMLSKVLILTQLDKLPEQDYSDIKLLLSDIDSYLNTIDTTMVII